MRVSLWQHHIMHSKFQDDMLHPNKVLSIMIIVAHLNSGNRLCVIWVEMTGGGGMKGNVIIVNNPNGLFAKQGTRMHMQNTTSATAGKCQLRGLIVQRSRSVCSTSLSFIRSGLVPVVQEKTSWNAVCMIYPSNSMCLQLYIVGTTFMSLIICTYNILVYLTLCTLSKRPGWQNKQLASCMV